MSYFINLAGSPFSQGKSGSPNHSRRGVAIVSVLFFLLIISILLFGVGTFAASHQQRATLDLAYAQAMDLAEAGVNYEFRKITQNTANADQYPGATYNLGSGSYKVYCTNSDGTTPWTPSGYLMVVSVGTVNGVTRTVKVSCKGYYPDGNFAIYTLDSISIWKGAAALVNGDVGTNGKFSFTSDPTINGSVYFDGADAGWLGSDPGVYSEVTEPNKIVWPTVDQIANSKFPAGGLPWLKTHNNNASGTPPIVNNTITSSITLTAGDYYVETLNLTGNNKITFDNSNGPVNLWIGPDGATGSPAKFRGGTGVVSVSADPSKANHIYCATQAGLDLAGNEQMDALIYAYNTDAYGNEYGYVTNSGNPTINGQIIANKYDMNGNITLNYITDLIKPSSFGYYGYNNSWLELNPR